MGPPPEGWYRDPYTIHQDRFFSAGTPTKLVRDGGRECYDPPPGLPVPEGELISAEPPDEPDGGADLRRADEASAFPPYDPVTARRAAFGNFGESGR